MYTANRVLIHRVQMGVYIILRSETIQKVVNDSVIAIYHQKINSANRHFQEEQTTDLHIHCNLQ